MSRLYLALLLLVIVPAAHASVIPEPPEINARAHLLVDATSGRVLSEHLADEPMPPASLTKIMTSYVLSYELAQGTIKNSDLVDVSRRAWAKNFPGSSLMWIEVDTQVTVEDLHRGIVISSGNDASVAIAEHLAGSEQEFAEVMNKHAESLGMTGSHFVNSHGLPHEDQYMTARDLAILAKALITRFPEQYSIYSEKEFTYNNITQANRNKLLWRDDSVDGLKTGHTSDAGYCLVASGQRDDMRLISVVMGTPTLQSRTREAQKLLSYGFRYFDTHRIFQAGEAVTPARVWEGEEEQVALGIDEDLFLTIPKGKHDALEYDMLVDDELLAPIRTGQVYGRLAVKLDGKILAERSLVALGDIAQAGIFARLLDAAKRRLHGLLGD